MKLKSVIEQLEKARQKYLKKHGVEPELWGPSDEDFDGKIMLCSKRKRTPYGNTAEKPYMHLPMRKVLARFTL